MAKTYTLFGIQFSPQQLRQRDSAFVLVDLIMLALVSINLLLYLFYWLYGYYRIQHFFEVQFPDLHAGLAVLYKEFPLIDFIFVSIFLAEFLLRWIIAIYRKTHHRWFFFPFIYWYDLLGSIPIGSFRFLRILRIFALLYRLQKMQVLNFRQTYLYGRVQKYRTIVVEEISDRVVLNVVSGLQKEVKEGLPVTDRVFREVLEPYRPTLVAWLSQRLQRISSQAYARYHTDLESYVSQKIRNAVDQNPEIQQLNQIPVIGPQLSSTLQSAIQDITYAVIDGMIKDMGQQDRTHLMDELSEMVVETVLEEDRKKENDAINAILQRMVLESLEVIKDQVRIQEWKLRERAKAEGFELLGNAVGDNLEENEEKAAKKASSLPPNG